jgi:hypothetical protein
MRRILTLAPRSTAPRTGGTVLGAVEMRERAHQRVTGSRHRPGKITGVPSSLVHAAELEPAGQDQAGATPVSCASLQADLANAEARNAREERGTGYVLAVACSHEVTIGAGRFRADALARKVPGRAWRKLSAGAGAEGVAAR